MTSSTQSRPFRIVERNMELTTSVMIELAENPTLVEKLPADFLLVVLPESEPDVWLYNLSLLEAEADGGRPVVFARVRSPGIGTHVHTSFYAPLAAA